MDRLYDSNLILNNVFSGSGFTLRQDTNNILNAIYDSGNNALRVNIQNLSGGTGSGTQASNEILINVVDDEVTGKQYQTFANAFAYIATQTPSSINTWSVRFTGKITENLMIPEFVTVVGTDMYTSIIDGTVAFEALGSQMLNTNNISNCTIGTLIGTSTLTLITSTVATSVPYVPKSISYTFDTTPTSGTYTITIAGAITTAAIDFDASLTEIRDAIRILNPMLGAIDVIAGGTNEYVVVFNGIEADSPVGLTVNTANLLPSTPGTPDFFTGQVSGMATDVTVTADNDGAFSGIELKFNGSLTITLAISDWNTLNPSNTCALTSGDGSQIPANKAKITLGGGTDPSLITGHAQLGDVEEQTIAFSEEAPTGTWTVDLTYDGTTYTSPVITSNNDTIALDSALLDIVSQVLVDKSVDLGIPVSTYNSGTFTFTITFEGFPGESAELVVTAINLSFIDSQFMGVDNCKILNASGTGSNGVIMNNCFVLGGNFSSFNKICFISNTFIIPLVNNAIFERAQINSCLVYAMNPGSLSFETSTINLSQCNYLSNYTLVNTNFTNCNLDVVDWYVDSTLILTNCALNDVVNITGTGNLTTNGCTLPSIPTNVYGGTWQNLGAIYDNRTSGLVASDVQGAIDEIYSSETGLVNRYYVGANGDFQTIDEATVWLKANMTSPSELLLDCGDHYINNKISINLPFHLNLRGTDFQSCYINASTGLTNRPMFSCISSVSFERVTFNATTLLNYGTLSTESAIVLSSTTYTEIKAVEFTGCYNGIEILGNNSIFVFDSIFTDIVGSGILVNAPGIATEIDIEVNTFNNCGNAIYLDKSSAGGWHIINNIWIMSNSGQCGCRYNPTDYTLYNDPTGAGNTWNNTGTFSIGFDYTRADGRDANVYVVGNSGRENKNPHGKINVINNTGTTTVGTPGTFYKASYTNTSSYTCKFTIENNKITYQPRNHSDLMMWISCNVITTQDNRNIDVAIVKNGNISLGLFGQMTVRATVQNQPFPISTNVYIDGVSPTDYFEIWTTNSGTGNVIVQDVSWLFDSK